MMDQDEDVLRRAREWEARNGTAPWIWTDVRAAPAHLVRLVIAGVVEIRGDHLGRHTYRLTEAGKVK